MNFERRLSELERHQLGDLVVLRMPDGRVETIKLQRGESMLDLFSRTLEYPESREGRTIFESVSAIEPGGSKLCELARALIEPNTKENLR